MFERLSRREFLRVSSIVAAGTVAAACGGPAATTPATAGGPTAAPAGQATAAPAAPGGAEAAAKEAPALAEMVAAGTLPPLEERLPLSPRVLTAFEEVGTYGGEIRTLRVGESYSDWNNQYLYDGASMWSPDASVIEMNLAESYSYNEDGTACTINLRKGVKFSDGEPLTSECFRFWWEDLVEIKDAGYSEPYYTIVNQQAMTVEVIDDYSFTCKFVAPHWLFFDVMGPISGGYMYHFAPAHYLKQFHPKYNTEVKDYALLLEKFPASSSMIYCNPDLPVITAWKTTEYVPGQSLTAERNPYYWKVDTDGKQLPYLDKWIFSQVEDQRVVPIRIVGGEVDFMARNITFDAFTEVKTAEEQGNYRMILWKVGAGGDPMFIFEWGHKDPEIRTLFRTRDFKLGMSYALDRKTINDVVYLGQGAVSQGVTSPYSPWGRTTEEGKQLMEQWRNLGVEYDVDKANELLDSVGLDKKDADGFRLRPSGTRLTLTVATSNPPESRAVDVMEMAIEYWKAVGLDISLNTQEPAAMNERRTTANYDIDGWDAWTGYHIPTIPDTLFPVGAGYCGMRQTALWYNTKGEQGEAPEPGGPMDRLLQCYEKMNAATTEEERNKWVLEGVKIHINDGPFMLAAVNDIPNIVVARKNLLNIPPFAFTGSWTQGAPGCTHPPMYFYKA